VAVGTAIVELVGKYGNDAPGPVRDYIASLKAAMLEATR
jgi:tryptophan synthase alpha chain